MRWIKKKRNKVSVARYTDMFVPPLADRLKHLYQASRGKPLCLPQQVWIEITNACNLQCVMCPVPKHLTRPPQTMLMKSFKKIIDQICIVKPHILLHVGGEPLLHANVIDMILYAKSRQCHVAMHTNGTLLTAELSKKLLDAQPQYISISFDGTTKEVYEKIRKGADFEQTRSRIEKFLELHAARRGSGLRVRLEMLTLPATRHQVDEFIAYWRSRGADIASLRAAGTWLGLIPRAPVEDKRTFGHRHCRDVLRKCAILADGTVVPCCRDINARISLGNVFETPFSKIWNGARYRALRRQHLQNAIPEQSICYNCPYLIIWW